jgi:hypothetical protein
VCYCFLEAVVRPYRGGANQNRDKDDEAGGSGPAFESGPDRLSHFSRELFERKNHPLNQEKP